MSVRRFSWRPVLGGVAGHRVRRAAADGLEARRLEVGKFFTRYFFTASARLCESVLLA